MRKYIRIIALVCLVAIILTLLCSCGYRGYKKEHKGAYTLVYSQVPDTLGVRTYGILMEDPEILLLETDSYGRGLYLYYESTEWPFSVAIVQKETEDAVYFYPEQSTLSFRMPDRIFDYDNPKYSEDELKSLLNELSTPEMLEDFKAQNDWNSPIDESKLESAEITSPKISYRWSHRGDKLGIHLFSDELLEIMIDVATQNGHTITDDYYTYFDHASWMATDCYGRHLYYLEGRYYVYGDEEDPNVEVRTYYLEMVAIVNPDNTYDTDTFMLELTDKVAYQDTIRELKINNRWNQPLEGGKE